MSITSYLITFYDSKSAIIMIYDPREEWNNARRRRRGDDHQTS